MGRMLGPGGRAAVLAAIEDLRVRQRTLVRGLVELALPARCAGCGQPLPERAEGPHPSGSRGSVLCSACRSRLPTLAPHLAATPIPGLDGCHVRMSFEGEAEDWIRRFKYPGAGLSALDPAPGAVVAEWLREVACDAASRSGPAPDAVVPVPLHFGRLWRRGFNPAAQLARAVAGAVGARLDTRTLRRTRATPSQTGLDRARRRRNVAGAFRAGPAPDRIWLVDDVVTTGATLAEAAAALRRAGAAAVVGICAARTP